MSFKKKYAVIGGAGFIGSCLTDQLIEDGHDVLVIDNLSSGKSRNINGKADFKFCDISKVHATVLAEHLYGCFGVFLLAARARVQPSFDKPLEYNETNVKGTLCVLEAMKLEGIDKIIYSSSSSVYGDAELPFTENTKINPQSPYGLQKYIGELYCELYTKNNNISAISLRYFNVYGNRMLTTGSYTTALGIFIHKLRTNTSVLPVTNDGNQTRDFTHVFDVVAANIKAMDYLHELQMKSRLEGEKTFSHYDVFNIGASTSYSVNKIVELFKKKPQYIGDKIEPRDTLSDCSKAMNILGWYPRQELSLWIEERVVKHDKYMATFGEKIKE